jgi:anhydro-N-acetylmuramic acid kinase
MWTAFSECVVRQRLPQHSLSRCRDNGSQKPLARGTRLPETGGMHYIGLMSGTSVDGIDAALVSIPVNGQLALLATHQHPFPAALRAAIQELMQAGVNEIEREGELDVQLGRLFAEATMTLLTKSGLGASSIRAIGSHGQTIRHRPHATYPYSRQIGNPSVIAEETGITTVADFRARDLAAGGEGAPLVPAFHRWIFRKPGINRAIVNIGGIANITWLPATDNGAVLGFDSGPGSTLLDQWVARHRNESYDRDGAWAASGRVQNELLSRLMADAYFAKPPPKSTGREHFNLAWLEQQLADKLAPADIQATLTELTAASIARGMSLLPDKIGEVYVCGGGSHNRHLLARLGALLPGIPVATTETLGLDPDWVESVAFAWLAHQTLAGHAGNLPSVTGARHPVLLGGIYLG